MLFAAPLVNIFGTATIIFLLFESMGKTESQRFVKAPQTFLMVGFFATIFMSLIVHRYFWALTDSFSQYLPTFILFFVFLNAVNTERKLKTTVWFVILVMFLLVFQGMYQVEHGYGWAGQVITTQGDGSDGIINRINWVGILNNPNDLVQAFVIAVGFLLPFVFSKGNFIQPLISSIILGFLGYGIYLTNSRGGILALGATVIFFFIRKTKKFILGGILGGLGVGALILFGPSRIGAISSTEESAANRLDYWYEGLQMFKASPFFGHGYGMFMEDVPQTAHNTYVLAFSELGFVGFFLWVALIYISMKGLLMVQNNNKALANYALGVQSALAGFCVASFFSSRLYVIIPYMLFAMAGSLVWITKTDDRNSQIKFDFKDARNVCLICFGILIVVISMIRGR